MIFCGHVYVVKIQSFHIKLVFLRQ